MSQETKNDHVILAFLIIFMVLTFLLSFLVMIGYVEYKGLNNEIHDLEALNNQYESYIKEHNLLFENLTFLKEENLMLNRESSIYQQRTEQLENLLNTRGRTEDGEYKIVFLTFDDGPSETTVKVLDVLRQYNIQATFFVNGRDSDFYRMVYRRIVDEGHGLGNHTYTHEYSTLYENLEEFKKDFFQLEDFLYEVTGTRPMVFRYPGGSNNQIGTNYGGNDIMDIIVPEMNNLGYVYADWNVDSRDASIKVRSSEYLIQSVLRQVRWYDISVVLMHDTKRNYTTAECLPGIIEPLREEGYVFLPMTERYIDIVPQFYEREQELFY